MGAAVRCCQARCRRRSSGVAWVRGYRASNGARVIDPGAMLRTGGLGNDPRGLHSRRAQSAGPATDAGQGFCPSTALLVCPVVVAQAWVNGAK